MGSYGCYRSFTYLLLNIYMPLQPPTHIIIEFVDRISQNTFLLITFVIFNGFSIRKRFSLSCSLYHIFMVHVMVQTGHALSILVVTSIKLIYPEPRHKPSQYDINYKIG